MNICACMGPQRGDPMCPCQMKAAGLTPTGPSPEEEAALSAALARFCATTAAKPDNSPV